MYTCITNKMRIRKSERTRYWRWRAGIKGAMLLPSRVQWWMKQDKDG